VIFNGGDNASVGAGFHTGELNLCPLKCRCGRERFRLARSPAGLARRRKHRARAHEVRVGAKVSHRAVIYDIGAAIWPNLTFSGRLNPLILVTNAWSPVLLRAKF
jgi:hypothetical protein